MAEKLREVRIPQGENTVLVLRFYAGNRVAEEGLLVRGKKDGVWKGYHPNGQPQYQGSYKNGKREGLWQEWNQDEGCADAGTGKNRLTGQLIFKGSWKDGKPEGIWEGWYPDGQPRFHGSYRNGRQDGIYKAWHASGEPEAEVSYHEGAAHGVWKVWDKDGRLDVKFYENGIQVLFTGRERQKAALPATVQEMLAKQQRGRE